MIATRHVSWLAGAAILASLAGANSANAQEHFQEKLNRAKAGGWYLTVGAAVLHAPRFEGSRDRLFSVQPLVSLGRHGTAAPFSSRNDNISLGLLDNGTFRAGPVGKLLLPRDSAKVGLTGLESVPWGVEIGGFAEFYPTDWLRLRGEVRRGFRAHTGVVGDLSADVFFDVMPTVRLSGGPRASFATRQHLEAYYGVDAAESAASGISAYSPGGGMKSLGLGGAVTWQATDEIATSVFAEYSRLTGPAANSSIVRERGSVNQVTLGVSATYRFDFSL